MFQSKKSAFTLIELLVVISIIALLLGILVPVLGAAKKNANIMKEGTNLRNVHAAMAVYGTANKDFFPGLTSSGKYAGWDTSSATGANDGVAAAFIGKYYAAQTNASTGTSAAANNIAATSDYAQAVILDEGGTTSEQWLSTGETHVVGGNAIVDEGSLHKPRPPEAGGIPALDHDEGLVDHHNNSYAQLAYGSAALKAEWKSNQNQMAVVFATRLIGNTADGGFDAGASESFNTVWTDFQSGVFKGTLVRGDTSSSVENFKRAANIRETFGTLKYGSLAGTHAPVATNTVVGPYGSVANADGAAVSGTSAGNFGCVITSGRFITVQIGSQNN